jgi:hypothetical protein
MLRHVVRKIASALQCQQYLYAFRRTTELNDEILKVIYITVKVAANVMNTFKDPTSIMNIILGCRSILCISLSLSFFSKNKIIIGKETLEIWYLRLLRR